MRIYLTVLFQIFLIHLLVGQQVKRSVISSFGKTDRNSEVTLCSTFGQPPNAGTIRNSTNIIRQGFQQPKFSNCLIVDAGIQRIEDECGVRYNFEYIGDMDPNTTFIWDFGPNAFPSNSTDMNPENIGFSTVGTQFVTVTVMQGGCVVTASTFVNADGLGFGGTTFVEDLTCATIPTGTIDLALFGGTFPYNFNWSNGSQSEDLTTLPAGTYSYTVSDMNGCSFEGSTEVNQPDTLVIQSIVLDETCNGESDGSIDIQVDGGTGDLSYNWTGGSDEEDLVNLSSGMYGVTVTDAAGCTAIGSYPIAIICADPFVEFNTFTPNGDGKNDTWRIPGIERFPDNEVEIYNRWGSVVFSRKGYTSDWPGVSDSGKELPSGGYYYVIRLNDLQDNVYAGSVTIIR